MVIVMNRPKTRLQSREQNQLLAVIVETCDPIQVTFRPTSDLFPIWVSVLRYRYMVDLPGHGYTCTWEDWVQAPAEGGKVKIVRTDQVKYNDSVITVRPLPEKVVQSTVRLFKGDNQILVMTLYYTTVNVLVQGREVIEWAKRDFDKLQTVVTLLADRPSKQHIREAWKYSQENLTLPPCPVIMTDNNGNDHGDATCDSSTSVRATPQSSTTPTATPALPAIEWTNSDKQQDSGIQTDDHTKVSGAPMLRTNSETHVDVPESPEPPIHVSEAEGDAGKTHIQVARQTTNDPIQPCPETIDPDTIPPDQVIPNNPTLPESHHLEENTAVLTPNAEPLGLESDNVEQFVAVGVTEQEVEQSNNPIQQEETTQTDTSVQTFSANDSIVANLQAQLLRLSEDFEDYKVQAQRKQLVLNQQRDQAVQELERKYLLQEEQLVSLQRKCQGLEEKMARLKKTRPATAQVSTQASYPITTITSQGRYAPDLDSASGDYPSSTAPPPTNTTPNSSSSTPNANKCSDPSYTPSSNPSPFALSSHVLSSESIAEPTSEPADCGHTTEADFKHARTAAPLKLLPPATKLIIGDSNLKDIQPKRLSRGGEVQVRTFRGAKVAEINRVFRNINASTTITKVVLLVGTNNVATMVARPTPLDNLTDDYSDLIESVRCKLPNAEIAISALPPQQPWKRTRTVRKINALLAGLCKDKGVTFLPHDAVWSTDTEGKVDPKVLQNKTQLSPKGLGLYLRDIKVYLSGKSDKNTKAKTSTQHRLQHPGNRSYADAVSHMSRDKTLNRDRDSNHAVHSSEVKPQSTVGEVKEDFRKPSPSPFGPFNPYLPFCMANGVNPLPQMFPWFFGRPPPTGAAGWPTPYM